MNNLRMPLKSKWFQMTKEGLKTEDYREITPYWCNRLAMLNGEKLTKERWRRYLITSGSLYMCKCSEPNSPINPITFFEFKSNVMTLGYPDNNDFGRILNLEHKGIDIRKGKPEWGAEKGKLYFVIKHGKQITPKL